MVGGTGAQEWPAKTLCCPCAPAGPPALVLAVSADAGRRHRRVRVVWACAEGLPWTWAGCFCSQVLTSWLADTVRKYPGGALKLGSDAARPITHPTTYMRHLQRPARRGAAVRARAARRHAAALWTPQPARVATRHNGKLCYKYRSMRARSALDGPKAEQCTSRIRQRAPRRTPTISATPRPRHTPPRDARPASPHTR
jgi:hypothetical protein